MGDRKPGGTPPSVEDQMIRDWASSGLRRLEQHLRLHARFSAYLQSLEHRSREPDERCTEDR